MLYLFLTLLFEIISENPQTKSLNKAILQILRKLSNGIVFAIRFLKSFIQNFKENNMSEENSTGTNLIWAITMIIIVAIIAFALYFTVIKTGNDKTKDIDIKVDVPASKPN